MACFELLLLMRIIMMTMTSRDFGLRSERPIPEGSGVVTLNAVASCRGGGALAPDQDTLSHTHSHTLSQQPLFVPIPGSPHAAATGRHPPVPPLGAAPRERSVSDRADRLGAFCLRRRAEQRAVFEGNGDVRMCERASDPPRGSDHTTCCF